jgi:glycosyltransferase involved in cell wall biosynthesis
LILYVGSIFNRRNVPLLLAAFAQMLRTVPDARLVVVGDNRTWPHLDLSRIARELGVTDRVSLANYVSEDELTALYQRASVFAFLSEYEGFGLTPLEALAAGVPIVVLDTPVAREVYGDAAAFVRADAGAVAEALSNLLGSQQARAAQLSRAANVLRRYSWDTSAVQTLDVLESAARR